jgi:hypothetical protein
MKILQAQKDDDVPVGNENESLSNSALLFAESKSLNFQFYQHPKIGKLLRYTITRYLHADD